MMTKEELEKIIKENPFSVLWEIIYQDIYKAITDGGLHPGDVINELKLSRQLGVSRSPVKRALDELMTAGILVKQGRKIVVSDLTSQDYHALYEARRVLEENAAYLAAKSITPSQLQELKNCLASLRQSVHDNNIELYRINEKEFHRIIIRATNNPYLIRMYDYLGQDLAKYQFTLSVRTRFEAHTEGYLGQEYLKHKRISDAIEMGFPLEAKEAVSTDMNTMFKTICRLGI